MIIADILFYAFAAVTVFSGMMVVTSRNPVHSVLFLILSFFSSAGLFVLLGAEFLAMLMVIVYVGAVAVLFLFVVMMLDINFVKMREGFVKYLPIGAAVALAVLAELLLVLNFSRSVVLAQAELPISSDVTNTEAIGQLLYTYYIYPFQTAGVILLVAMVGAIVLTFRERSGVKRQNISKQVSRKKKDSIAIVKVNSGEGV